MTATLGVKNFRADSKAFGADVTLMPVVVSPSYEAPETGSPETW